MSRTVKPAVLSIKDAGTYLGISRSSVHKLMADGTLTPTVIGKTRKLVVADLDRYIARGQTPAPVAKLERAEHRTGWLVSVDGKAVGRVERRQVMERPKAYAWCSLPARGTPSVASHRTRDEAVAWLMNIG